MRKAELKIAASLHIEQSLKKNGLSFESTLKENNIKKINMNVGKFSDKTKQFEDLIKELSI